MIKKNIIYALLLIFFYVIQFILVPFSFNGVSPDYLFVLFIMIMVFENEKYASIYGLIIGLLTDYSSHTLFGIRAITYMILGYVFAVIIKEYMKKGYVTAIVSFATVFVISRILLILDYTLIEKMSPLWAILLRITLPDFVMTLIFTLLLDIPFALVKRKSLLANNDN